MQLLPPDVLAKIGQDLDTVALSRCVAAARALWPLLGNVKQHSIRFYCGNTVQKLANIGTIMAHVHRLCPRLETVTLRFVGCFDTCSLQDVSASSLSEAFKGLDIKGVFTGVNGALFHVLSALTFESVDVYAGSSTPEREARVENLELLHTKGWVLSTMHDRLGALLRGRVLERLVELTVFENRMTNPESTIDLSMLDPRTTQRCQVVAHTNECWIRGAEAVTHITFHMAPVAPGCRLVLSFADAVARGAALRVEAVHFMSAGVLIVNCSLSSSRRLIELLPKTVRYVLATPSGLDAYMMPPLVRWMASLGLQDIELLYHGLGSYLDSRVIEHLCPGKVKISGAEHESRAYFEVPQMYNREMAIGEVLDAMPDYQSIGWWFLRPP